MTSTIERPRLAGPAQPAQAPPPERGRLARVVRGRAEDPRWARPGLLTLLALTAVLYVWDLSASGYANSFYAAAVQSGTQSWKAWFFGSPDPGNSITVDKPPAALWIMGLSARVFGFDSWSLLVPQAMEGVAAVGLLWRERSTVPGRVGLAAMIVAAGGWSFVLLGRTSSWYPELRWAAALLTVVALIGVLVPTRRLGRLGRGVVVSGMAAGLIGTASFGVATAAQAHTGSIPSVGPAAAQTSSMGGGAMGGGAIGGGSVGGASTGGSISGGIGMSGTKPSGTRPSGTAPSGAAGSNPGATGASGNSTGGMSVGGGVTASATLVKALQTTSTTWAAAVSGDNTAAELELASGSAVMSIGGWDGSDSSPTLAQFQAYVSEGRITYYISGGQNSSSGSAGQIASWVAKHFRSTTVGGTTVYDLTSSSS